MQSRRLSLAAALVLTASPPSWAHHSHSNYFTSEYTLLDGTVTEFLWMNPHTWIFLEVTDADGRAVVWALEGASPTELTRDGWTRDDVEVGDQIIGGLLANSPIGDDGVWPCEAVREVLENTPSKDIATGMCTGVYNSRGVVSRGDSGEQERVLAEKYMSWARQVAPTHPFTASMLERIAESYEHDATRWDIDAEIRARSTF